jgi:hypothetical protein
VRAQRVRCSNRDNQGGCGKSFAIYPQSIRPFASWNAPLLNVLLSAIRSGNSIKAAHEKLPTLLSLESAYASIRRIRLRTHQLRAKLTSKSRAPPGLLTGTLQWTIEHLRHVCGEKDPVGQYQLMFQIPFAN